MPVMFGDRDASFITRGGVTISAQTRLPIYAKHSRHRVGVPPPTPRFRQALLRRWCPQLRADPGSAGRDRDLAPHGTSGRRRGSGCQHSGRSHVLGREAEGVHVPERDFDTASVPLPGAGRDPPLRNGAPNVFTRVPPEAIPRAGRGAHDRSPPGTFAERSRCGEELLAEHAHFRCLSCGWRDVCCN
jgi:hypothetical protein